MNTQEHIKNCKGCGNGFYPQGLDVCQACKVKRQGYVENVRGAAMRQASGFINCVNAMRLEDKQGNDDVNQGVTGGKDHREAQRYLGDGLEGLTRYSGKQGDGKKLYDFHVKEMENLNKSAHAEEEDYFDVRDIFFNRLCWFVSGMTVAFILDWLF